MADLISVCGVRLLQLVFYEHLEKDGRLDPNMW